MDLIWKLNGNTLKDGTINNPLVFPVVFPATVGTSQTIAMTSSATIDGTFSTLENVKLYLQGDPDQIDTLLNVWTNYGTNSVPQRPDLNGGIEISFDNGSTFTRLGSAPDGTRIGFPDEQTTWITLPASCIVPGALAGTLGPVDIAMFSVRYIVPPLADQFQIFNVRIEVSFDVV
jgi:hypothetical protein